MAIAIEYNLTASGWAECIVEINDRQAYMSAFQQVLATHGLDGYREQWVRYDFPIELQAKLKASLDRSK